MTCLQRIIVFSAGLFSAQAWASEATAFDAFVGSALTIQAEFVQQIYSSSGEMVEESAGRLAISRPDRFRWEYDEPEQLIVADGQKLWLYDIELDQITISEQAGNLIGSPAALLAGDENALDGFDVLKQFTADNIEWTRLQPRESGSDFHLISLGFSGGTIVAMELQDALEQVTRMRFSSVKTNTALADDLFAIDVPEGVDVINQLMPAE